MEEDHQELLAAAQLLAIQLADALTRNKSLENMLEQNELYTRQLVEGNEWLRRQNGQLLDKVKQLRQKNVE